MAHMAHIVSSAPALSTLRRVDLIHVGSWPISSGMWNPSREDLAAAIAALDCPAVRRPVIKLGHSRNEQPLWAGNPTGCPAVGWVDNMALANQGHTLVGDFVGMPSWLATIMASAYADRSVEGTYDRRCQLGHTHPFVITAVALLGVTPPGIGTLRSLQDVATLYGVKAAAESGTPVVAYTPTVAAAGWEPVDHPRDPATGRFIENGTFARATLRLADGDILNIDDIEGESVRIGFVHDGRRHEATLTPENVDDLVDVLREGLDDGYQIDISDDVNLSRDGGDYYLDFGPDAILLAEADLEHVADAAEQARRPRVTVQTASGDLRLKADMAGDVELRFSDGASVQEAAFGANEVEGLIAGLDEILDVDIADDTASGAIVDSFAINDGDDDAIELTLYGSGVVRVGWDDGDEQVELDVDPEDVETVRDALQQALDLGEDFAVRASAAGAAPPAHLRLVEAAADVHTGAMVALVPSAQDAARLAVEDGEPVDQLHTTLIYLGRADQFDEAARQKIIGEMRDLAAVIPPGEVDGFAASVFNPHDTEKDTAIVIELQGDGLEDVHGMVEQAATAAAAGAGLALPQQYAPWRPHVTVLYTGDVSRVVALAERTGPVLLDRLRVAFAGQIIDLPLTGEGVPDLDVEGLTDEDMPDVQVAAQQSRRVTRSDRPLRRYWQHGKGAAKIRWGTPGDWTRCVRQLRRYVRDPKGLCAVYHREAVGFWPGDRRNRVDAAFDLDQPRDEHGRWADMHLATADEITAFRDRIGKAIPPAWTDVHIADDLDTASLLVIGRDSKGRRQAIYSATHTAGQAAKKFARVRELDQHLDKLDHALERDAGINDDAAALLLIRRLGMRPGSTRDTLASQQAYGATTLLARHVTAADGAVEFDFVGKKGVNIRLRTDDPTIVDAISRRLAMRSDDDRLFDTTEGRTRDYMHSTGVPGEFLLKDLRTVHANVVALREIAAREGVPGSQSEFQRWRRQVATAVAAQLGNTPMLALSSYINPTVFTPWVQDPQWVAAAVAGDAAVSREQERALLAAWFAAVTFDEPEPGIPAVEPDPQDEDDDSGFEEVITLPNPNSTIIHAAAGITMDDLRTAYYRQAPQQAWIREIHQHPQLRFIVANDADGTTAQVDVHIADDGTIRFGPPVAVRVEYVAADEPLAAASPMVYASAAESRVVMAHGSHNQKSHGRRYRVPGDPTSGIRPPRRSRKSNADDAAIRGAYDALARGEGASIEGSQLEGLLTALMGGGDVGKRANLAHLDVGGYGTLFATDKTDALDRSQMPQLGTNEEEMRPFLDLLRDQGVDVSVAEIDPTTLRPSQSEISGAKTGKLAGFMAADGWLPGGLLVTSVDGYVVDGHHRWSGAAAVRASGQRPDMTVTGLVVDRPIDEVLQLAASVAKYESLETDRMVSAAVAISDQPWSDTSQADYTAPQWRRACLLDRGVGDPDTKERYGLPVREPDGTLNRNAVHAAASGHGIGAVTGISAELRRRTARQLVRLYRTLREEPPASLMQMAGLVTAAAHSTIEEDDMSLTAVRRSLGLADGADESTILAAIEGLMAGRSVAASLPEGVVVIEAAALEALRAQAKVGAAASERQRIKDRDLVIAAAVADGRISPARTQHWQQAWQADPDGTREVLTTLAPGLIVPTTVQGSVGPPQDADDDLDPEPDWLFGPGDSEQSAMAGEEN